MSQADSDLVLMQGIAGGDSVAVRTLVDTALSRIFRFSVRILQDAADAEEVAQEVMVRACRQAPHWQKGEARLDTWLHTVALNLCRDKLRDRARRAVLGGVLLDIEDPDADPESRLVETERSARVASAIRSLPERQRDAILLVHYQDLSGAQAAKALGISVEALESLLSRARRRLRQDIMNQESDDD
ncbi:sigma-70 family RNA polymerase sigma factor [Rhizobium sp. 9140]|uniref:sigma-70 family RNA polymerase sigma factor n=1 Tax=Rhizobium sp. 9140 TaxID=1761900 RepID=UPI00079A7F15|nr:sigma-70 family RNA polymerase sigma factor [Rhizobium sp. 9140]CZT37258.1 RNA polymerase sigma-70 factor, ECF subfamily [Rhizobium sp. 9140]